MAEWPIGLGWYAYARLVAMTSRVEIEGDVPRGAAIFVNWHRYQAFLIVHHGVHARWMLVSPAPPLRPIARFCRLCGLKLVRGTSGDRGKQALDEMAAVLAAGEAVTIAVDGPAGPRFVAKRGCVDLAARTGVPIVPVRFESRRGVTLRPRWDHILMPSPFDRIVVRYGAPMQNATIEEVSQALLAMDAPAPAGCSVPA